MDDAFMLRARLGVFVLFILALLAPQVALARPSTGTLVVTVRSAKGGPLALAQVVVEGPRNDIAYTDDRGVATFHLLPAGSYRGGVMKKGYHAITFDAFAVRTGKKTTISVAMAPFSALKTIARVVVHAAPRSFGALAPKSTQTRLAGTLADALGSNPAIGVPNYLAGNTPLGGLRVDGQSVTDNGFTLNGIPLGGVGGIGAQLDPGLFAGVNATPGNVNFQGFQPTIAWQTHPLGISSQAGGSTAWISQRGTIGNVGVAFVHTDRTEASSLDGQRFSDTSGLTYPHDDRSFAHGNYLRLRIPFPRDFTAGVTFAQSAGYRNLLCRAQTVALPCGYGPGNATTVGQSLLSTDFSLPVGALDISSQFFVDNQSQQTNFLNRLVAGFALPLLSTNASRTTGAALTVALPPIGHHSLAFSGLLTNTATSLAQSGSIFGSPYNLALPVVTPFNHFSLQDRISAGRHWQFLAKAVSQSGYGPTSISASLNTRLTPDSRDQYELTLRTGQPSFPPPQLAVSDVGSLQFSCIDGIAWGTGTGYLGAPASQNTATLDAEHRFGDDVLGLHAYRTVTQGGFELGYLPASSTPQVYDAAFAALANQLYQSPLECGAAAAPLTLENINILQSIPTGRRVYQGLRVAANLQLGSHVTLEPYYAIDSAVATSLDPAVIPAGSTIVPGLQLPQVPLHRYGITAQADLTPSLQAMFNLEGVSSNNPADIPSFTFATAALRTNFHAGALQLGIHNLFNVGSQRFGALQNSVAMPRSGAGPLIVPTLPLQPRAITLTYTTMLGRRTVGLPIPIGDEDNPNELTGEFIDLPLPKAPPNDPFGALTTEPGCTPEAYDLARPLLASLDAYRRRIEAMRAKIGHYPVELPPYYTIRRVIVFYHRFDNSYALDISFPEDRPDNHVASERMSSYPSLSFGDCTAIHMARNNADLAKAGGYLLPSAKAGATFFLFAPRIGVYLYESEGGAAASAPPITTHSIALPATTPTDPFALSASCPSEVQPLAAHLLATLSAYVKNVALWQKLTRPDGWKVARHKGRGGWWLSLTTSGPTGFVAIEECATVAAGKAAALAARGFGGLPLPTINFTPTLGLYIESP